MSVEQFTVQASSSIGAIALVALVVTGAALLLLAFLQLEDMQKQLEALLPG